MYPHYRPLRPTGDVDARVHMYRAATLGRGRVASPKLGRFYPRRKLWYSSHRRLSEPQDLSGHEGVNSGRPARGPAPCRLSYLAHIIYDAYYILGLLFFFYKYVLTGIIASHKT